jgi:hypothetical protein
MDKHTVVYPNNGIDLAMKRKNASSNKKSWRNLKYILTGE